MLIETRKIIVTTLIPTIILLVAMALYPHINQQLPSHVKVLTPYLPYAIFSVGMVLSWMFRHSREFNLLLLFLILYIAVQQYHWISDTTVNQQLAYLLITLLIPVNFLMNTLFRERGILNHYGIRRIIILGIQLYFIAWVLKNNDLNLAFYLSYQFINHSIFDVTLLSQPVLLLIGVTSLLLIYRIFQSPSYLNSGILGALIAGTTAMHFISQPAVSIFFFCIAGSIIIVSISFNAHSLAFLDELTNLPSRRALKQSMASLGKRFSIAMIDIDHFKKFNDRYGHDVGDQVLRMLASHLRQVRGARAFRYGGEEFTLLFNNKNIDESKLICDALCQKIANSPFILRNKKRPKNLESSNKSKPVKDKQKSLTVTISIGLAERNSEFLLPDEVIKQADTALYRAKKAGRNRVSMMA